MPHDSTTGAARRVCVLTAGLALASLGPLLAVEAPASADGAPTPLRAQQDRRTPQLPGGGTDVFDGRFVVAYYGTPANARLGVLGHDTVARTTASLKAYAEGYRGEGRVPQIAYEVIATVADPHPGPDGDFNHDVAREHVEPYVKAARFHGGLVILDLQPGRQTFLQVIKRWRWLLKDKRVGVGLDPEWRVPAGQRPGGGYVGTVSAAELNRASGWLQRFTRRNNLPEKIFLVHTFGNGLIRDPENLKDRRDLAEVIHNDGMGPPGAKIAAYQRLARPRWATQGFKVFRYQDQPNMTPRSIMDLEPDVELVTVQ